MTSTIDNTCANINIRFESVESALQIYQTYDLDAELLKQINDLLEKTAELKDIYISESVKILSAFYDSNDEDIKKASHVKFIKAFHSNNIIGELDRIYAICKKIKKICKSDDQKLKECIKNYEMSIVDETFINTKADVCIKCNVPYEIEEKTAEYICKSCGRLEKMSGVVFEDEQFFYQEGQRTKHGKYDPIKHAKCWLERIQAKEMTEIPTEILNEIKVCIKRDQLWLDQISCDTIRGYLKRIKKTEYNNHVPLIRKLITGREPAQLTEHETQLVYMYFGTVIQTYINIKSDPNCPYHPFFIYKIIEQVLKGQKHAKRRKDILSCIHLQSRYTLIENDRMWFSICSNIPEFTKIPTSRQA